MFQAAVFTLNSEIFKEAPRLCLCESCLSKYGLRNVSDMPASLHPTESQLPSPGAILSTASSTTADTVWFVKIVEECVAAHDIEDDYGHKISQRQQYVVGSFLERTRSTKKELLIKEESKKTSLKKALCTLLFNFLH